MMDLKKMRNQLLLVGTAVSTVNTINSLGKDWKGKYDEKRMYTARVGADAYVYPPLMQWLNDQAQSKAIRFDSTYRGIRKFYDGKDEIRVSIKGHSFKVLIEKPSKEDGDFPNLDEDLSTFMAGKVVFKTATKKGVEALTDFLEELTESRKKDEREVYLWAPSTYGGWGTNTLPDRPLESVFLPQGVKEEFCNDLATFFENEEHYRRIGVPWHRGYLFHGPPGNGKTSLVSAVAHEFKMHLYNLPLSSVKDDKELTVKISDISPRSILLLEDIDIFSRSMKREQAAGDGPTLAGLLNALDGVGTPHGLLTFMTTNRIETLDDALIRPGRVDFRMELLPPDPFQVKSMFKHAYGEELGCEPRQFDSMAALTNVFKRFTLDPESARMEIKAED